MSLSLHLLYIHALSSQKQNRENRIKNTCLSNSHSNIAPSNDKRPLFVQIPATSSASLVSTSLPIQCLRPSNFFFFRGIFLNSFLHQLISTHTWSNFVHASSNFDHTPAPSCSSTIKFWSRSSLYLLVHDQILITWDIRNLSRHQISFTRHQNLITWEVKKLSSHRILFT